MPIANEAFVLLWFICRTRGQAATTVSVPKAGMVLIVRHLPRLARISPAGMVGPAVTPPRATPASALQGSVALTVNIR